MSLKYITTDADLIDIADAIRSKTGASTSLTFPTEFISSIGSITNDSWQYEDNRVFTTNITQNILISGTYSYISSYAFYGMANDTKSLTIDLTQCKYLGDYALYQVKLNLTSTNNALSLPLCEYVGASNFENGDSLYTKPTDGVFLPECSVIGTGAFYSNKQVYNVSIPKCEHIMSSAFYNCANLSSLYVTSSLSQIDYNAFNHTSLSAINFDWDINIGSRAFSSCSYLTSVNLPSCSILDEQVFAGCTRLLNVSVPNCNSLGTWAFSSCYSLGSLSLPKCSYIGSSAFAKCTRLIMLYLLSTSLCTLKHSNAFTSTPIGGYTTSAGGTYGSIFVPASLFNSYKTATNWAYFSSRFVSV